MCLCLSISRSEAVINDPTKLIINSIVPTFMSLDSFLDSSIFNLQKNQDASGGFDYKNQGELALGVGRESVSGVLPLYLFKEHKDIVRLKMQPLYGFMCTLDPMGFAASQSFTIPFLVLLKAIDDVANEPTEAKKVVLKLVIDTCVDMVSSNGALKKQIIEQANNFATSPGARTADVIASVQLLTAQLVTLLMLPEDQQAVENPDPQSMDEHVKLSVVFNDFARAATEEISRRAIKRDTLPLTKDQILAICFPEK